ITRCAPTSASCIRRRTRTWCATTRPAKRSPSASPPRRCKLEHSMHLTVEPVELPLARPFRVASFTIEAAHTVVARLEFDGLVGLGEASPLERYGDTVPGIIDDYSAYAISDDDTPFAF